MIDRWMRYCFSLFLLLFPFLSYAALDVLTIERPPFVFYEQDELTGFSVELRTEISSRLGLEFDFRMQESFGDMLGEIKDKKADLAIANISITSQREHSMDFSYPIFDSGLIRLVKNDAPTLSWYQALLSSSSVKWLFGICFLMLVLAHVLYLFKRDAYPSIDDEYIAGIGDALFLLTTGQVTGSLGVIPLGKSLIVLWILGSFFLLMNFMSQISGTDSAIPSSNFELKDLIHLEVGVARGTTMSAYLDKQYISYTAYDDFSHALDALDKGEIDITLGSAATSQYYAQHEGKNIVSTVGDVFEPDKLAIAFRENSPLQEKINSTLLKIKEDGTYEKLYEQYFGFY